MDKRVAAALAAVILAVLLKTRVIKAAAFLAPGIKAGTSGKSYLGRKDLPRGMRNNNPGNLRISAAGWIGKIPPAKNRDGAFEQFYAYTYGVRAMIKLLQNYVRDGYDTIEKIVNRYAPPTENRTKDYVAYVELATGISRGKRIDSRNRNTMRALVQAMAYKENGQVAVTDGDFEEAWEML